MHGSFSLVSLRGSLLYAALERGNFWHTTDTSISQGSVATCLRYCGKFNNHFSTNLLGNLPVK